DGTTRFFLVQFQRPATSGVEDDAAAVRRPNWRRVLSPVERKAGAHTAWKIKEPNVASANVRIDQFDAGSFSVGRQVWIEICGEIADRADWCTRPIKPRQL